MAHSSNADVALNDISFGKMPTSMKSCGSAGENRSSVQQRSECAVRAIKLQIKQFMNCDKRITIRKMIAGGILISTLESDL